MFPSYIWQLSETKAEADVAEIAVLFGLSPAVAAILLTRCETKEACAAFLKPELKRLRSPREFPGVEQAAVRVVAAILRREPITVFGDYDADGVTATVLMVSVLKKLGACVKPFIPDRETEGYGLTEGALTRCLEKTSPKLLITVDCGITAVEPCARLSAMGIDVVLTDHHMPGEKLPEVCALVNPRVAASPGAESLCGCGVAFKVAHAAVRFAQLAGVEAVRTIRIQTFLDLVALATIADIVDVRGENRILVAEGLRFLNPAQRPGLRALIRKCCKPTDAVTSTRLAFGLAPRLNAAGRMGEIRTAYRLLLTDLDDQAIADADALETHNETRKAIEQRMFEVICREHGLTASDTGWEKHAIVAGGEDFHPGVVGVVAARLVERVRVPAAVAVHREDGSAHGSMRAFAPYHAVDALQQCSQWLQTFGGHPAAAGFTVKPGCFEAFAEGLYAAFSRQTGDEKAPPPPLMIDSWLESREITCELARELGCLEPFGEGNRRPVFAARNLRVVYAKTIGADQSHLLLRFELQDGRDVKGVWFSAGRHLDVVGSGRFDVAFHLEEDTYTGVPVPSLLVSDLRPAGGAYG